MPKTRTRREAINQMLDTLSFLAMAPKSAGLAYARETHNNGAFDAVWPIDPKSGFGKIIRIKDATANTLDVMLYDEEYVYDHRTELIWNDPRSFKKFIGNFTNAAGKLVDGIPRCERYIKSGLPSVILPGNTNYLKITDCKSDGKTYNVGEGRHVLSGPYLFDHGGDIKIQSTYIDTWQWGGKKQPDGTIIYNDEEIYWYVPNYGLARWTHSMLDRTTGQYAIGIKNGKPELSIHNMIIPGGAPAPNFPCG
jgi:hypothetical protein